MLLVVNWNLKRLKMRYECKECLEIIDEGEVVKEGSEDLCPECGGALVQLDDSEYGN